MSPPLEERLSLSTCWLSHRHTDGYDMMLEIKELGFIRSELSHGIRVELVPGILRACEEGWIEISSVHNFCPLPNSVTYAAPNLFQPSARRKREIFLWDRYTRKTMEFASLVGASHIVMHSGSAPPFFSFQSSSEDSNSIVESPTWKKMRKRSIRAMSRVAKQLLGVEDMAREKQLVFGIENREDIFELPLDDGFDDFFERLSNSDRFAYWHDTGHAAIKERLGLLNHREHLESQSDRLAGFHLHDVSAEGKDHQVPGSGTIDFKMIREFIRPEHVLVAELSPRLSREDVLRSREFLLSELA